VRRENDDVALGRISDRNKFPLMGLDEELRNEGVERAPPVNNCNKFVMIIS
jgi:hypothetical protein